MTRSFSGGCIARLAKWTFLVLGSLLAMLIPGLPGTDTVAAAPPPACTNSWNGAVDGLWSDATKWSMGAVPSGTDDVCITLPGSYTVTVLGGGYVRANTIQVGTPGSPSGATLVVQGTFDDYGYPRNVILIANNGLFNTGTVVMDTSRGAANSQIQVTNGVFSNSGTLNVDPGTGGTRSIYASLDNSGTVNINYNASFTTSSGVFNNTGSFTIAAGVTSSMTANYQVFNQNAGSLVTNGTFDFKGGTVNYNGGGFGGTSTLYLTSSTLNLGAGGTGSALFVFRHSGLGGNTLGGNVSAGQTLWLQGTDLTSATDFTNAGTIRLDDVGVYDTGLYVTDGVVTNAVGGVLRVEPGAGRHHTINANMTNLGTIELNGDTWLKDGGAYTNSGTWSVAAGKTMTTNTGGTMETFNQNAGVVQVDGTMDWLNTTVNYNGGTFEGPGALKISGVLNLGLGGTAPALFQLYGGNTFSGDPSPGQILWQQGSPYGGTVLYAAASFTNHGTIRLETNGHANGITLQVNNNGTITNAADGLVEISPGTGGDKSIASELHNYGTVNVGMSARLSGQDADHVNHETGTINVTAGTFNINEGGTSPSFTNNGTINIASAPTPALVQLDWIAFYNPSPGRIIGGGNLLSYVNFYGVGTLAVEFDNRGNLRPGTSPGILNITGNYTQTGSLHIEVGGPDPGTGFDQLNISGQANLGGSLYTSLINGYVPDPCGRYQFLTYGSWTGDFAWQSGIGVDLGGGIYFRRAVSETDQTIVSYNNASRINIYPTTVNVAEGGPADTYNICLATATSAPPTADVTVTANPNSQVTVFPSATVFPVSDWQTVRTVSVEAVDDTLPEGLHIGLVDNTSTSADPSYDEVSVASVTAEITDDDAVPQLTVPVPQSAQYSDALSFDVSATDPDNPASTLRFGATGLPAGLTLTDNLNGTATISGTVGAPAGTYDASISVADPQGHTDIETVAITVAREGGTLNYTGVTRVYAGTPITLTATLAQAADGSLGNLTRAAVIFDITNSSGGTTSYGPLPVSAAGQASYVVPGGQPQGTYTATVRIDPDNGYFTAPNRSIGLVASDPSSPLWAVQYRAGAPSPGFSYALPFFEFWQQVLIRNRGASAVYDVVANIARVAISTEVVDGQVSVGTIPAGGTAWSSDTFRLRVNLSAPPARCDSFVWSIQYADQQGGPPHVLTDRPQFPPGPAPGGCR